MSETPIPRATRREWWGLAVLVLPTILLALDMTVLHLAVPLLAADLKPTSAQLLWILDIYGFMIAGFLVTMGTLGDRIGRRRLLLTGAVAFGLASILAAYAHSATALIVARALLGVAGATLMPSTLSLIRNMFRRDDERTLAITVWMTGFIVGSAIGPLVGGAILAVFSWGAVFLLGVPVMVLLLIAGPIVLPEFRDTQAGRLDVRSALLSVAVMLSGIYALKDAARHGGSLAALVALVAALLLGWVFVRRQRRLADPMLDLDLFANRAFTASVCAVLLTLVALSGTWLMIYQYLQGVIGLTPLRAGVVMLPAALVQVAGAAVVPVLARRLRPAVLVSRGLFVAVAGFGIMAIAGEISPWPAVLGSVVMGVGVMPMMIMGTDLVVGSAPPERAGAAAAISETAAELGMALGIALLGSLGAAVYRWQMGDVLASLPPAAAAQAAETLSGALALASTLGTGGDTVLASARHAFTVALHANAAVGAAIALATALGARVLLRHLPVGGGGH
ncbi:MFS transporter [Achromobacter sp. GG226]|nr:MFS transporter [Verticiella sp. GG226]MBU4612377.1 MFS transporter [Verticiella sp. GG226]